MAFSQILPDETAATAARFLVEAAGFLADHRVTTQRVLTDNAKAYTESILFAETAAGLSIRLKRTRCYRPQTNGRVERFNRTLLEEWAYRPHTALDGLTPMAVLVNNVHENPHLASCGRFAVSDD